MYIVIFAHNSLYGTFERYKQHCLSTTFGKSKNVAKTYTRFAANLEYSLNRNLKKAQITSLLAVVEIVCYTLVCSVYHSTEYFL